jgi:8-oxo-dGTP pyrophosphatase MutT (NUDIX family)
MIPADDIGETVRAYLYRYPAETDRLAALSAALVQPGEDLTSRKRFSGHVTCTAIVLDGAGRTLHIRHNILDIWLYPGGHLEADDTTLIGAALREMAEETGISAGQLAVVDELPIDIDVHSIPANPAKDEPDHQHFDMRFAFAVTGVPTVALQTEEVHDFAWFPMTKLQSEPLRGKLAEVLASPKVRTISEIATLGK